MVAKSIVVRALLAVFLMVLFVAAAIGAVAGLLYAAKFLLWMVPEIRGRGVIMIALAGAACIIAAGVVAWSVLPRPDRFEPPGPEISVNKQPALFAELRRVANATGEAMPVHVYVVNEVNAFVAERGGVMGIGSRRVMGLGLPLLRTLTVSELRAVIAHEMGHFYGGDTKLGPWIYKARGSMIRTVVNLDRASDNAAAVSEVVQFLFIAVRAPFKWLATGFLRVSQAVSRAQEYAADAVAVRTEGAPALINGLKKSHAAGLAHQIYLRNELSPLIDRGVLPPVGEGFTRFLGQQQIATLLADSVDAELAEGQQDPYDSHPPLRERVAAALEVSGPTRTPDDRPAIELMIEPEQYETAAIRAQVETPLTEVAWADTATHWVAAWREQLREHRGALGGLTFDELPATAAERRAFARKVAGLQVDEVDDDAVRRWCVSTLGAAVALALVEHGFAVESEPGAPHRLVAGAQVLSPFTELSAWWRGEADGAALRERYREAGLGDEPLISA